MLIPIGGSRKLFIRGPFSMNQILEFSKYGINAIRIFLYIRYQEGKLVSAKQPLPKEHTFIKLDNKTLESTVGIHRSNKWDRLRVLEENGLIELKVNGAGKAPEAKIIVPSLH